MGLILLAVAVLAFVALGIGRTGGPTVGGSSVPARAAARAVATPLRAIFGSTAFTVPFALAAMGLALLLVESRVAGKALIVRVAAAVPTVSCLVAGVASALSLPRLNGGLIGGFFVGYLIGFLGSGLGVSVALVVSSAAMLALAGVSLRHSHLTGKRTWQSRIWPSVGRAWRALPASTPARSLAVVNSRAVVPSLLSPPLAFQACVDRATRVAEAQRLEGWVPDATGSWPGTLPRASWPSSAVSAGDPREAAPAHDLPPAVPDEPLPLSVLPEPGFDASSREQVTALLPHLQASVLDIVQRTAGVRLIPGSARIGLNSILLEYAKGAGQTAPVRSVERAEADVGVETGRAPVRIEIRDVVRIELPLLDSERCFVPILPLMQETSRGDTEPTFLVGRSQGGAPFELDVTAARHLLVGGATGSGKSVLLHSLIFGMVFRYAPSRVRLALVDNKLIEFARYEGLPHLWQGVVSTSADFAVLVDSLFAELQSRKQAMVDDPTARFPALVTIVDEFSEFENRKLVRLIAEARALGMHFVLATQYPRADIISTTIKANLVTRIALRTEGHVGSDLIIGCSQAETLKERGDCLVRTPNALVRVQGGWVRPEDIAALAAHLAASRSPA